jgi:GWxTD domain-containing protein
MQLKFSHIPSKTLLFLISWLSFLQFTSAQPIVYNSFASFNTPNNQPYLETCITLVGKSLLAKKINNQFQHSVNIAFTLFKDTTIVKANKYNLSGPLFSDSLRAPNFIDNQRYSLKNGVYEAYIIINDNHQATKKPLVIIQKIVVNFNTTELQSSTIQALESYKKTEKPGPLSKSGFDLMPYTVNYYPETTKELAFYVETYNTETSLGANKAFVYSYFIEKRDDGTVLGSYGAFKKQITKPINPLLAKMDISKLGTGDYNLVVQVKDENNTLKLENKYFFHRLNQALDIVQLQKSNEELNEQAYFGHCNNADTLKMFVECLWPIADGVDKERTINQSLKKDPELMKKFVIDFWTRRAADTANPVKLWGNYYKQVQKVMVLFKCGKQKGYYTDRGRVYLQYGPPDQRSQQANEVNTYPYEIWQYYRANDATNGQFFSNRRFVFVSRNLGDDCYSLVHSDMRGEVNNPRWQFEITRRSTNGLQNPDNNVPAGTENNQFNEIYSNPR